MPIDENRLDVGGLVGLASNRVANLNLPVQGVQLGAGMENEAKGIAGAAELRQKYAGLNTQLQDTAMQVNGTMANARYKAMADMNMAQFNQQNENLRSALQTQSQQQIAQSRDQVLQGRNDILAQRNQQEGQFQAGQLGIQQQNANTNAANSGLNAQRLQQQAQAQQAQQQNEAAKTAILAKAQAFTQNKDQMDRRAGAAATLYQAVEQAKQNGATTDQLSQMMNKGLTYYNQQGIMNDTEYKGISQLPFDQQEQQLHFEMGTNYLAKNADLGKLGGSSNLSPQVVSKLQTDKTNIEGAQTGLSLLKANNSPDFYNTGAATSALGAVEGFAHINGQAAQLDSKRTAYFDTMVPAARDQLVTAFGSKVSTRTAGLFNDMLPTKSDPNVDVANSKIQAMNQALQLASQLKDNELSGKKYDSSQVDKQVQQIHDQTVIVGTFKGQPITKSDLDHNEQQYGKSTVSNSPDLKLY